MMGVEQTLELEVVALAERWVSRWNAHDVEGILALVTEDITWEDPSIDGTARGLADARRYIKRLFRAFPDITWAMPAGLFVTLEDDDEVVEIGVMPARGSGGERMLVRLQRLRARLGR